MTEIELPRDLPGPWGAVGELVELLPRGWVLIGGLMVQIHAWERGMTDVRATVDVDVLGQARPQGALRAIDAALTRAGFEATLDSDGYAHRYVRGELIVDVLAPDGMNPPPTLDGTVKAVGVPGGSQALTRAETVIVRSGDQVFQLRRPTLLGALLIKARLGALAPRPPRSRSSARGPPETAVPGRRTSSSGRGDDSHRATLAPPRGA